MSTMDSRKGFPRVHRYITTHNLDGEAVFISACQVPECAPTRSAGDDGNLALLYSTDTFPVQTQEEADVAVYDSFLHTPPGLTPEHGTVLRVIDMQPQKETPMHRTVSVDYGVVLEGEVDLVLDSGQSRTMRRGDVSIQRGTAHSFRNRSDKDWCRILFTFLPMQPLTVAGKQLQEEWYDEQYESKDGPDEAEDRGGGGDN
jgi:quercetin dioxygenase-like cupin family protein